MTERRAEEAHFWVWFGGGVSLAIVLDGTAAAGLFGASLALGFVGFQGPAAVAMIGALSTGVLQAVWILPAVVLAFAAERRALGLGLCAGAALAFLLWGAFYGLLAGSMALCIGVIGEARLAG